MESNLPDRRLAATQDLATPDMLEFLMAKASGRRLNESRNGSVTLEGTLRFQIIIKKIPLLNRPKLPRNDRLEGKEPGRLAITVVNCAPIICE